MLTILRRGILSLLFSIRTTAVSRDTSTPTEKLQREVLARPGRTPVTNHNLAGENCAASSASCARTPGGNAGGQFANPTGLWLACSDNTNKVIGRRGIVSSVHCLFHVEQRRNPVGVAEIIAAIPQGS